MNTYIHAYYKRNKIERPLRQRVEHPGTRKKAVRRSDLDANKAKLRRILDVVMPVGTDKPRVNKAFKQRLTNEGIDMNVLTPRMVLRFIDKVYAERNPSQEDLHKARRDKLRTTKAALLEDLDEFMRPGAPRPKFKDQRVQELLAKKNMDVTPNKFDH